MANILWIDNDRTMLLPFVARLESVGHTVIRAFSIPDAEYHLNHPEERLGEKELWGLIIIDIMMSVRRDEALGGRYSADATKNGKRTGVIFFANNKDRIAQLKTVTAFLTMSKDPEVVNNLLSLGVPQDNIMYKMNVADTRDFLVWVEELLAQGRGEGNG
jgi:CheY-like chemotaxis protein